MRYHVRLTLIRFLIPFFVRRSLVANMPEPASTYSYSEYSIASSEASLNARWYKEIQQWTHDLPPDSASNTGSAYPHLRAAIASPRHAGEEDNATELGTVLPTHSVSRRASLAERRQWKEQQAEFARRAALQGLGHYLACHLPKSRADTSIIAEGLPKIDELKVWAKPSEHGNDRRSVFEEDKHALTGKDIPLRGLIALPHAHKNQDPSNRMSVSVSPGKLSVKTFNSDTAQVKTLQVNNSIVEQMKQPSRGRRPPTPYHPPSNLALTEISEDSVTDDGKEEHVEVSHPSARNGPAVLGAHSMFFFLLGAYKARDSRGPRSNRLEISTSLSACHIPQNRVSN